MIGIVALPLVDSEVAVWICVLFLHLAGEKETRERHNVNMTRKLIKTEKREKHEITHETI